jgi:hypothetical protein
MGEKTEKNKRNKIIAIVLILIIIALITKIILNYTDIVPNQCNDLDCYNDALFNCNKFSFTKEDDSSAWNYKILGFSNLNSCKVKVRLTKIKKGDLALEGLQNKEMICEIKRIEPTFPEKDLSKCTGLLKEGLQQILINRMHKKLFKNISEIMMLH